MSRDTETRGSAAERPLSPHIQIYRPQLTSVLSILHRLTGVVLAIAALGLVLWLWAVAGGAPDEHAARTFLQSWVGQGLLLVCSFCFFLHLCGGIRHLVWDTVHGLTLHAIYASGWTVVAASVTLTAATWAISVLIGRHAP